MTLAELVEALDQRYGNPHAGAEYGLIQEAIKMLCILEQQRDAYKEAHEALLAHNIEKSKMNYDQGA
jgi:hypothetical protein